VSPFSSLSLGVFEASDASLSCSTNEWLKMCLRRVAAGDVLATGLQSTPSGESQCIHYFTRRTTTIHNSCASQMQLQCARLCQCLVACFLTDMGHHKIPHALPAVAAPARAFNHCAHAPARGWRACCAPHARRTSATPPSPCSSASANIHHKCQHHECLHFFLI
jgi:hypothetical protein